MKNLINEARTLLANATPNSKLIPLESQQQEWAERFGAFWAATTPELTEGLGMPVGTLAKYAMESTPPDEDFAGGWNKAMCLAEAHIEDIDALKDALRVIIALDEKGMSPSNADIENARRLVSA